VTDLTLFDVLRIIGRRFWLLAVIVTIVASFAVYLNYFFFTPYYSNSSTLLVNDRNSDNNPSLNDVLVYEKLIGTYKDIIRSKRILVPVVDQYGGDLTYRSLIQMLTVSSAPNSQVITVTVTSTDYKQATELANRVAETFSRLLPQVMTIDNVQILDSAERLEDPIPVKPRKKFNVFVSFVFSVFASAVLILVLHVLDTKVRTEEELVKAAEYPLLGSIPKFDRKKRKHSILS
jgi:capsular polysaccharide biosynthesis protein